MSIRGALKSVGLCLALGVIEVQGQGQIVGLRCRPHGPAALPLGQSLLQAVTLTHHISLHPLSGLLLIVDLLVKLRLGLLHLLFFLALLVLEGHRKDILHTSTFDATGQLWGL